MEDKIFDIVTDLIRDDISKEQAIDKLLILHSVSNTEGKLCDKCYDTDGFYLGTTCPKCNKPFRSVKA